jgi:uncharacterized protein YndB with AHSA1/START domain
MSENSETDLVLVHLFDASAGAVFDAWTGREQWQSWLGPKGVHCEISRLEARVGGRYLLTMYLESGETIAVSGEFKAVDRPRLLVFTWGVDGDGARQSLISLSFRALGAERTELTLRQEGLRSVANREAHGAGWESAFQKLAARLASRAIPFAPRGAST